VYILVFEFNQPLIYLENKLQLMTTIRKLTWTKTVLWTCITLLLSAILGYRLVMARIFPAPPMAEYTLHFYTLLGLFPALILFGFFLIKKPGGSRIILAALPFLAGIIFFLYLGLIGPGLYEDIQCQPAIMVEQTRQLECQCRFSSSEGDASMRCVAEKLSIVPLIKLVEER